ncbi:cytochrome P450 [Actinophytocola sp.]|uniref:cytochrome P450 n=1 Tax=Actinophytocola sp. TaxID=1872138 RepID=UPI002ED0C74F
MSPIDAVRQADPYPYYASLVAERPFSFDEELGLWVAAGARAVDAVLSDPTLRVRPADAPVPPGIVGTPAGDVFGNLVRMTDGDLHDRLKDVVVTALGRVDRAQVVKLAADRAARTERLDELMFNVPAQVVATVCGLDDGHSAEAARLIGDFVRCLPASATPDDLTAAATAAAALRDLMGPALDRRSGSLLGDLVRAAEGADWHETGPLLANGIGFLSQTYDATAGLIGNTLLALARHPAPADLTAFVDEVVRHDAPVHNTRRFAVAPFRFGDAEVEAGQSVLAVVAAANRDPEVNPDPHEFRADRADPVVFTFGAGPHGCPGQTLAVAITVGVVGELLGNGFDAASLPDQVDYRPLPNIRIPVLSVAS